jgi:hypothetical protein
MSKAKKETQPTPADHEGKGFFALAGEAFAVLGEDIVEGKDKVVEVAAAKFTAVKKAIKKIAHKKAARTSKPAKKAVKKTVKKAAAAPKKVAKKAKAAPKKAAKKKSSGRRK